MQIIRNFNLLTPAFCDSVTEPGRYSDGGNLYFNVSPAGAKSWVLMYRSKLIGKRRELGLGSYTGDGSAERVGVKEARLRASEERNKMTRDPSYDPVEARLNARKAKRAAITTFRTVMLEAIAHEKNGGWTLDADGNSSSEKKWLDTLGKLEGLLATPIQQVTEELLFKTFKPIWAKAPESSDRLRGRVEKVIAFAIDTDKYVGKNPAAYTTRWEKNVGRRPTKAQKGNRPSLPYAELPAVYAKLRAKGGTVCNATCFTTLTWVRTSNTRFMTWAEIDEAKRLWTIPYAKMKQVDRDAPDADHVVPLSDEAWAIIEEQRGLHPEYVFPGKGMDNFSKDAMNDKLVDDAKHGGLGLKGKASMHGMRATVRTWANEEAHFADQDLEFALSHVKAAEVAAYQRGTSVEKRRPLMQATADYCTGKLAMGGLRDPHAHADYVSAQIKSRLTLVVDREAA